HFGLTSRQHRKVSADHDTCETNVRYLQRRRKGEKESRRCYEPRSGRWLRCTMDPAKQMAAFDNDRFDGYQCAVPGTERGHDWFMVALANIEHSHDRPGID